MFCFFSFSSLWQLKTHKVYIKCLFCAKKSFGRNLMLWILATILDFISDENSGKAFCISGCPITLSCGYFIRKVVSFYFSSLLTYYFSLNFEVLPVGKDKRRLREQQSSRLMTFWKRHESYVPISHCSAHFQKRAFRAISKSVEESMCLHWTLLWTKKILFIYFQNAHGTFCSSSQLSRQKGSTSNWKWVLLPPRPVSDFSDINKRDVRLC